MSNRLETAIKASAAEARLTKQKVLKELHNQVAEAVAKVAAADEKIKTEELFKALQ